MLTLGLDTSLSACSAALVRDGQTIWSRSAELARGHAEVLPTMVAQALGATNLAVSDLDRIGVTVGPGAFAGMRVGLAFARGLCLGSHVTAVGVSTLRALAAGVSAKTEWLAPLIDARRGQVYAALYSPMLEEILAPFVAAPDDANSKIMQAAGRNAVHFFGSGARLAPIARRRDRAGDAPHAIDPSTVAGLAAAAEAPTAPPTLFYLRPPDAAPSAGSIFSRIGPL